MKPYIQPVHGIRCVVCDVVILTIASSPSFCQLDNKRNPVDECFASQVTTSFSTDSIFFVYKTYWCTVVYVSHLNASHDIASHRQGALTHCSRNISPPGSARSSRRSSSHSDSCFGRARWNALASASLTACTASSIRHLRHVVSKDGFFERPGAGFDKFVPELRVRVVSTNQPRLGTYSTNTVVQQFAGTLYPTPYIRALSHDGMGTVVPDQTRE